MESVFPYPKPLQNQLQGFVISQLKSPYSLLKSRASQIHIKSITAAFINFVILDRKSTQIIHSGILLAQVKR